MKNILCLLLSAMITLSSTSLVSAEGNLTLEDINGKVWLTEQDFKYAVAKTQNDMNVVEMIFTEAGRSKFKDATAAISLLEAPDNELIIKLNGEIIFRPYVSAEVDSSSAMAYGNLLLEEAQRLTKAINDAIGIKRFSDVEESHWAFEDIVVLANSGIINGYEDDTFRPNSHLTRAEMAKIITIAFDLHSENHYPEGLEEYNYKDKWFVAYADNICDYYANAGHQLAFSGNAPATRRDVAHTLVNALNPKYQRDYTINGYNVPNGLDSVTDNPLFSMFTDMKEWLYGMNGYDVETETFGAGGYWDTPEHIYIAARIGLINGYPDGTFLPHRNITRAEFCAIVNRALALRGSLPEGAI